MTDLSMNHGATRQVPLRTLLADSFGTYLHLLALLWQAKGRTGDRSITARLKNGDFVPLEQGFRLDGTTFVVNNHDGTTRRIPASQIGAIEDKGDWGYV